MITIRHGVAHANLEYASPFGRIDRIFPPAMANTAARMAPDPNVAAAAFSTNDLVGLPFSDSSAVYGNITASSVPLMKHVISEKRVTM